MQQDDEAEDKRQQAEDDRLASEARAAQLHKLEAAKSGLRSGPPARTPSILSTATGQARRPSNTASIVSRLLPAGCLAGCCLPLVAGWSAYMSSVVLGGRERLCCLPELCTTVQAVALLWACCPAWCVLNSLRGDS